MSKSTVSKVTCPKCKMKGDFTVYPVINTVHDPELAEKLKDLSLFSYTCPSCNTTVPVDYGLLYHDMDKRMMIYYVRNDAGAKRAEEMFLGKGIYDVAEDLRGKYLYRVVRSKRQLKEKIDIFDAGLDDRYMEMTKLFYMTKFQADYPDLEASQSYVYGADGVFYVAFSTQEGEISTTVNMSEYNYMKEVFPSFSTPLRGGDVNIDFDWAMKQVNNQNFGNFLSQTAGGDIKVTVD